MDDSLNLSTQSYYDESSLNASLSFHQNENDITISEIIPPNELDENNQIIELFKKGNGDSPGSGGSSTGSSPSIDDLLAKRKVKKYAIEADQKLSNSFDEIKSKLAHQVINCQYIFTFFFLSTNHDHLLSPVFGFYFQQFNNLII